MSNDFSDKFWVAVVITVTCSLVFTKIINSYDAILLLSLNQIFIKLCEIHKKP